MTQTMFENNLNIRNFYKEKKKESSLKNLTFLKPDKKRFNILKVKSRICEYPSTPIIINAANEILVKNFLQNKTTFLSISRIIIKILNDRNYKKYAIRTPKSINQIRIIDDWARSFTLKLLEKLI